MASHAFITSWLMAPSKGANSFIGLGKEWGVGFRGQTYSAVSKMSEVFKCSFSYKGGGTVGVSPASSDSGWRNAFSGTKDLGFCGYYWWNNSWFGGFIDWWPITSGNRNSRPLTNADGAFEMAARSGIKRFAFCFTDMSGRRTNIQEITL